MSDYETSGPIGPPGRRDDGLRETTMALTRRVELSLLEPEPPTIDETTDETTDEILDEILDDPPDEDPRQTMT